MTAYDSPQLGDILGMEGSVPLLVKPFGIQELMKAIQS